MENIEIVATFLRQIVFLNMSNGQTETPKKSLRMFKAHLHSYKNIEVLYEY